MLKKRIGRIILICGGIIAYIGVLIYLSLIQSDYKVLINTEQTVFNFSDTVNEYEIPITLINKSNRSLNSGTNNIFVSYHLYDKYGNDLSYDNIRTTIEKTIYPGDEQEMILHVTRLDKGEYLIKIDLVQEYVEWFSDKEDYTKEIKVSIE